MPNNRKKKSNNKKNKNRNNKNSNKCQNQQQQQNHNSKQNVTTVIDGVALTPPQVQDHRNHADDERKSDVDELCNYRSL